MVKFRTPYEDDYVDPGVQFVDADGVPEVSRTVQAAASECDINEIVRKNERTGLLPVMSSTPIYGDVTDAPTFQEALHIVQEASAAFAALSAPIRARFDNDPVKYLAFCDDPKNLEELRSMGLANPAPIVPPDALKIEA